MCILDHYTGQFICQSGVWNSLSRVKNVSFRFSSWWGCIKIEMEWLTLSSSSLHATVRPHQMDFMSIGFVICKTSCIGGGGAGVYNSFLVLWIKKREPYRLGNFWTYLLKTWMGAYIVNVKDTFNVWNHCQRQFQLTTIYLSVHGWSKCDKVPCLRAQARFKRTAHDCDSSVLLLGYNSGVLLKFHNN